MLSLAALGGAKVTFGGRILDVRSKKATALLLFLALRPTGSESRERLCGLLWSESPNEKARTSLRQVLHGLKQALDSVGFSGLVLERDEVRLERSHYELDTRTVVDELRAGRVPPSLSSLNLPHEALLQGLDGLDPSFDVWLAIERRLWRERLESLLFPLSKGQGGDDVAVAAAMVLMNIDPTNEEACRILMRHRAARGEISAALKIYNALWSHLEDEYDMEPSPETQALAVELKSAPGDGVYPT